MRITPHPPYSNIVRLLRRIIFFDRESGSGLVSRASSVHTAMRNCTRDGGGPFEVGNQVLISSHRKLLRSKAVVVNVAETSGQ
jgi:hypothetical protein